MRARIRARQHPPQRATGGRALLAVLLALCLAAMLQAQARPAHSGSQARSTDGCCAQEVVAAEGGCCCAGPEPSTAIGAVTCCADEEHASADTARLPFIPAVTGPGGDDDCCRQTGSCACQPLAPGGLACLPQGLRLAPPASIPHNSPRIADPILDGGLAPPEQPPRA